MTKWKIVSTETFDELDLDKLDEELYSLGFILSYSFYDDLLELKITSIPQTFIAQVKKLEIKK